MENTYDLEEVLAYLTGTKKIKINEVTEKLGLVRGGFQSWRRSSNLIRKQELTAKIMAAYPEHFEDGRMPGREQKGPGDMQERYIALLEQNLRTLQMEVERLREENIAAINRLKQINKE